MLQKELSKYAPGLEVHAPPMLQALRGKKMGARLELRVETDIAIILSEVSSGRLTPANKNLLVELVCREADGEAVFDVDDKSAFRDVAGYLLEVLNVLKEKTADNLGLRTCIRRILPDDEAEAKRKLEIYVIKHLWRILLFVETQEPENIVKTLAEVGVDIHARDEQNKTILHWASIEGRAVAVYALSSEGIDVNAHDNSDHTALHYAVIGGHVDVLSELIKVVGINVNTQDGLSQTVLHYAAIEGDVALVNVLLATGAYVNAKDDRGRTALHFAASKGHLGIVKLLLEQGAEVNAKDDRGRTALHWAADRGHFDVVKLLLAEGADVNAHDNSGYTALHYAAAKGHVDVFNALLAKGADVHAVTDHDETALHLAADFDVVNLLHAKGADANAKDNEGCTALHWAAAKGRFGVVNALLAKGADVNAHDDNGYTALHWAAAKGHVDVVNALLAKGVDVNAKNYKGQVALDLALERRHVDVISALANAALAKVVKEEAMQYLSPLANPQTITELTEVTKLIEAITKDGLAVIYDQIKSRITERMREEFSSLYRDKAADLFTVLIDSGKDTVLEGLSQFQEQLEKSEGYHEDCRQRLRQSGRFFSAQAFSEPSDAYPHGGPADLGAGDRQASEQPSEATHTVGIKREREEEQEQEDFQASERLRTGV